MAKFRYAIERKTTKSGPFKQVFKTTKKPSGASFEQLKKDSPYFYKVRKL